MTITVEQRDRSDRLRGLIDRVFPVSGRFAALEVASGISASRWKNFFYKKQAAGEDMLQYWCKKYPHEADYLLTGRMPSAAESGFAALPAVRSEGQSIGDRLLWVVSEWAGTTGASLFHYLEEKSQGSISADEWSQVIMRLREPSAEMIAVVCGYRPHFTEWVVTGQVCGEMSVDPTSPESIAAWRQRESNRFFKRRARSITSGDVGPNEQAGN